MKRFHWSNLGYAAASCTALVAAICVALLGAPGCGGSGGLTGGLAAAPLPEFNELNTYAPYFATGEMVTPRYFHRAIRLANGQVLAVGGSDENGFSTIDTAEIFDQSTLQRDEVEPESKVGTWFDTNFEGEPITLEFGRVFHTITTLPNDKIIVIGGSPNANQAAPLPIVEVFDALTRTFDKIEGEMFQPRFRHAATSLDDGRILISGGQIKDIFTETDDQVVVGGGQQQGVTVQTQTDIFPSTRENEVYSITEGAFSELTITDSNRLAELAPSRGRAGHTVARFAGPDNRLNTGDDLYLLAGGFQTASGENAPQTKLPGDGGGLTQLEFYDPIVGVFTEVPVIRMSSPRCNDPQATNLGVFNEFTTDGVLGMGNAILVTHGDNNATGRVTAVEDELYVATFTGFGPAQGLQLFAQDSPYFEHVQGIELASAISGDPLAPVAESCTPPGRSTTNIVVLPRRLNTISGTEISTWIFAGGGVHMMQPPPCPAEYFAGTVASGAIFDPFYSLTAIFDFDSSARDLRPGRRNNGNPVGIIGTWLALDGRLPTISLEGFGDTAPGEFAQLRAGARAWTYLIAVGGEDGVANTIDDRVLFVGGGSSALAPGGEPSFPSSEIVLIPGTGTDVSANTN